LQPVNVAVDSAHGRCYNHALQTHSITEITEISAGLPRAKRRRPARPGGWAHIAAPLLPLAAFGLGLAVCLAGFVHFTAVALYKQAHFAPEAMHPDDGYAAGCLFLGMALGAGLLLALREPPPMRWRRVHARHRAGARPKARGRSARRSGTSGTIGLQ